MTAKSNAMGQKKDRCKERIGGRSSGENKEEEGLKERRKEEWMKKERMKEERRKKEDTESGSKEDKVKSGSNKEEEVKSGRQEEVLEMRVEEEDDGRRMRELGSETINPLKRNFSGIKHKDNRQNI